MPAAVYIPTILMTVLGIRIRRDKLLTGLEDESRSLVMYFVRLFIVTFISMVIGVAVTLSLDKIYNIDLKEAIGCTIFDRLGVFQVCLALSKEDVRIAFKETWCCRRQYNNSLKEEADVIIDETELMVYEKESTEVVGQNEIEGKTIPNNMVQKDEMKVRNPEMSGMSRPMDEQ